MESYIKIRVIGKGTFGSAWLAESVSNKKSYALKEINVAVLSSSDRDLALNEVEVLSKLRHKNIIRYREAFINCGSLNIIMEYAGGGDLYTKLKEQKEKLLSEETICDWFIQLCLALKYTHGANILHRDLKTQNIFLTKVNVIKLGDFGIAKMLNNSIDHAQTAVGTPYYLSPEICQRQPYNHKSDMWALGCVLYEMTTLKHPFHSQDFSGLVVKILHGKYIPVSRHYSALIKDIVSVLLQVNPDKRPSAKQVLHVPALKPHVDKLLTRDIDKIRRLSSARNMSDSSQLSTSQVDSPRVCEDNVFTLDTRVCPINHTDRTRSSTSDIGVNKRMFNVKHKSSNLEEKESKVRSKRCTDATCKPEIERGNEKQLSRHSDALRVGRKRIHSDFTAAVHNFLQYGKDNSRAASTSTIPQRLARERIVSQTQKSVSVAEKLHRAGGHSMNTENASKTVRLEGKVEDKQVIAREHLVNTENAGTTVRLQGKVEHKRALVDVPVQAYNKATFTIQNLSMV